LGARAVIDALNNSFDRLQTKRDHPLIVYAGNNLSEDYLYELIKYLENTSFGIINISKSGTNNGTGSCFRLLKDLLEDKVGKSEARNRMCCHHRCKERCTQDIGEHGKV